MDDAQRTATATLSGVRPRATTVPTGIIMRSCSSTPCPTKHSASQPLSMVLQLPNSFSDATARWTRGDGVPLTSDSSTLLTIKPEDLASAGTLIELRANITLGSASGLATLSVPINSAPYCPAGTKCLTVDQKSDSFADSLFVASASGFADDDDGSGNLKYEWGTLDDRRNPSPVPCDDLTACKFSHLPKGPTTIYVRAKDPQGAFAEERTVVVVQGPPANFSAAAAVAAVNMSNVVNTGDPALLTEAAHSIAALASYGLSNATTTSDSAKQELQAVVNNQGAALLVASKGTVDVRDPAAAQTTALGAASMVKVMSNISEAAAGAALEIGKTSGCPGGSGSWVVGWVGGALCLGVGGFTHSRSADFPST